MEFVVEAAVLASNAQPEGPVEIPVLVESVAGNGYRARSGEPLALTAEGATEEEALRNLQGLLTERLASAGRLVTLPVPGPEHPLARFAGRWKDDPLFDDVVQIMEERRRQDDQAPDAL
jgi:hypothetical protein